MSNEKFSQWLQEHLTARGVTVPGLARRVGVLPATARSWAHGRSAPASAQIPRLAEVLGVPVTDVTQALE